MAEFTCQEARQIVDEVAQRKGSIAKEDRAATPPAVIKALQSVRNQLISSTCSLRYNWAKRQGEEPYFTLDVSRDCMIIETKDDGWQKSDFIRLSENIDFLSNTRANNLYGAVLVYMARIASKAHARIHGGPEVSYLDPTSTVVIDDSDTDYKDALEDIFVPRASIAWGRKDQLQESEQSQLQLVLRSK